MKLTQGDKLLVAFLTLVTIVCISGGFEIAMKTLLVASFIFFLMCVLAHVYDFGTKNPVLKYLVVQSTKSGLPADETYRRGIWVSGLMFLIIPLLYSWAAT